MSNSGNGKGKGKRTLDDLGGVLESMVRGVERQVQQGELAEETQADADDHALSMPELREGPQQWPLESADILTPADCCMIYQPGTLGTDYFEVNLGIWRIWWRDRERRPCGVEMLDVLARCADVFHSRLWLETHPQPCLGHPSSASGKGRGAQGKEKKPPGKEKKPKRKAKILAKDPKTSSMSQQLEQMRDLGNSLSSLLEQSPLEVPPLEDLPEDFDDMMLIGICEDVDDNMWTVQFASTFDDDTLLPGATPEALARLMTEIIAWKWPCEDTAKLRQMGRDLCPSME